MDNADVMLLSLSILMMVRVVWFQSLIAAIVRILLKMKNIKCTLEA